MADGTTAASTEAPGWHRGWRHRIAVTVGAAGVARDACPVVVRIDYALLLAGSAEVFDPTSLRVVEVSSEDGGVGVPVPSQYDAVDGETIWLLEGETDSAAIRRFHVYFGCADRPTAPAPGEARVALVDEPPSGTVLPSDPREHPTLYIRTEAGTWGYRTRGGAFGNLVDRDGRDWISSDPTPGTRAGGEFRGTPNMPYPDGWFHAGGTAAITELVAAGPLRVTLRSSSPDGRWAYRSEIYPRQVTCRVTATDDERTYWWLYEGTPGGTTEYDAMGDLVVVRPDGLVTTMHEEWTGGTDQEAWVLFGTGGRGGGRRAFFVAHHEGGTRAEGAADTYFPMGGDHGAMTVFGFGRSGLEDFLRGPHTFTMGLVDGGPTDGGTGPLDVLDPVGWDPTVVVVRGAYRALDITVGAAEHLPTAAASTTSRASSAASRVGRRG